MNPVVPLPAKRRVLTVRFSTRNMFIAVTLAAPVLLLFQEKYCAYGLLAIYVGLVARLVYLEGGRALAVIALAVVVFSLLAPSLQWVWGGMVREVASNPLSYPMNERLPPDFSGISPRQQLDIFGGGGAPAVKPVRAAPAAKPLRAVQAQILIVLLVRASWWAALSGGLAAIGFGRERLGVTLAASATIGFVLLSTGAAEIPEVQAGLVGSRGALWWLIGWPPA